LDKFLPTLKYWTMIIMFTGSTGTELLFQSIHYAAKTRITISTGLGKISTFKVE